MEILPITAARPACYGICCDRRKTCQRYDLIEQASTDHTISTCDNGLGDKPLFVAIKTAAATPQPEVIQ